MQRIATFNSPSEMPNECHGFRMMLASGVSDKMLGRISFSTSGRHLPHVVMQRIGKFFRFSKRLDSRIISECLPDIMPPEYVPRAIPAAKVEERADEIAASGCAWYVKPDKYFARGELVARVEPQGKNVLVQTYEDSIVLPRTRLAQYLLRLGRAASEGDSELIMQREVQHTREVRVLVQREGSLLVPKFMYVKRKNAIGCNVARGACVEAFSDAAAARVAVDAVNSLIEGHAQLGAISKAELVRLFSVVAVDLMVSRDCYVFCEHNVGPGMDGVRVLAPKMVKKILRNYLENVERCMLEINEWGEELFYARAFSGKAMPVASADMGPSARNSQ